VVSVAELPLRHPDRWARATRHPFLAAVRDGSLPAQAFNTWLAQDYRFVGDLLRFQSRLLARAPRLTQPVLVSGASALVDELAWFARRAEETSISLTAPPLPAAVVYAALLDDLDRAEVPLALAMLWTIERTYLDAWSFAAPGDPAYREFVDHWTDPAFTIYVDALATAADAAGPAGPDLDDRFRQVVEAEISFWEMAWEQQ
jgi:formylaminopyrimidine deformylase / aminopyrimidine aminohydrolase